jgi:hypothetical protein
MLNSAALPPPRTREDDCRGQLGVSASGLHGDAAQRLSRSFPVSDTNPFHTFREFYPFYLGEHANRICRRLHFAGTSIAVGLLIIAVILRSWWPMAVGVIVGYAFAWIGHFFFEHNKPATFKYPLFSFMGDWRLWWDVVCGRVRL